MKNNKQDQSLTVRKVLKSEITALVGVLVMVFSFIMFVITPQMKTYTELELIKASIVTIEQNHLTHIQGYGEELVEIKKDCARRESEVDKFKQENGLEHIEIIKALERLNTITEINGGG